MKWISLGEPQRVIRVDAIAWFQPGPPNPRIKLMTGEEIEISEAEGAALMKSLPPAKEASGN